MPLSPSHADNGIEVRGLVREFKGGIRAGRRDRPRRRARRDLRLPRPQRRRQVDDRHMLTTLLPPTAGTRARRRATTSPREGAARARARSAPRCRRPRWTRSSPAASTCDLQAALHGLPKAERQRARRRAARARRPDRGGRPQGRRLLGRHEAPPRPRARARAPPARSCSSTSRRPASTRRAAPRCGTRSRRLAPTTA